MLLSVAEVVSWSLTPTVLIACLLLDYILAYTVLGTVGFFRKGGKVAIVIGVVVALVLRLLMHFISGVVLFGEFDGGLWSGIWVSLSYNMSYMVPEMITSSIVVTILLNNKAFYKLIKS